MMSEDKWKKGVTSWANYILYDREMIIQDLTTDLSDGILLINIVECILGTRLPKYHRRPKLRFQKLANIHMALQKLKTSGFKVCISAEDICDGCLKLIIGLLWSLMLRYNVANAELLTWVQDRINIPVTNFTSSWEDGKAFTAIVNSFTAVPPSSTNDPKTTVITAMDIAESQLKIPKIMDAQDIVTEPDELIMMTYISYFRNYEKKHPIKPSRISLKHWAMLYISKHVHYFEYNKNNSNKVVSKFMQLQVINIPTEIFEELIAFNVKKYPSYLYNSGLLATEKVDNELKKLLLHNSEKDV